MWWNLRSKQFAKNKGKLDREALKSMPIRSEKSDHKAFKDMRIMRRFCVARLKWWGQRIEF